METVWTFSTDRFRVALQIESEYGYRYDGDDPDGEVQAKLDSGEYVAFDSVVTVFLDGKEIGSDYLSGSVYAADGMADFWTAHRSADPANRNCSFNHYKVGHYFPDMVRNAICEARTYLCSVPAMRCAQERTK